MIEFVWDNKFKRSYKKRISQNTDLKSKFNTAIKIFSQNPFDPKLKTHKLSGALKD
jgi:mRNA-degrading endonuclease YafQ of YafQ-DinJ toxin-antitoxin module